MKKFAEDYISTNKLIDEIEEIIDRINTFEKLEGLEKTYKDTMYEYIKDATDLSFETGNKIWNKFVFTIFISSRLINRYSGFFTHTLFSVLGVLMVVSVFYNYLQFPESQQFTIQALLDYQLPGDSLFNKLLSMQLMKTLAGQIVTIILFILLVLKPLLPYTFAYYKFKDCGGNFFDIFTKTIKCLTFKDIFGYCFDFLIVSSLFWANFLN